MVRWLLLLTANEDQNLTDILEAIALEQDETLQKAIQKWDNMSHNQQFRREYKARMIRKLYENEMASQDITNHVEMHIA
ncbi:hypothetical protein ACTFRP_26680 [Bacillus cereus group sp. MYBK234-1]|uniref:hypothetical protein n=1 Tax=unclassified Bacillus cereus group TaxID=2750818 RepID=UPI003F7A97DE